MKIKEEYLVSIRKSKDFTIELDNKKVIVVNKWIFESEDGSDDTDYDIIEGEEFVKELSEEDQDKLYDFINDIKV